MTFRVDTWSTKKSIDRMKNDDWPKNCFYQKPYVLYGIIAMFGACVVNMTAWWPNANFYFLVNCKSSQHFTYLYIHTIHTFSIAMWLFVRNLLEKVPHHVQGSKISQISSHQGSQCVHTVLLKMWFFHLVNAIFAARILQIFVQIYAYKMYLYFVHF